MKKVILLLVCAILATLGSAQTNHRTLTPKERDPFLQNPEVKLLIENFQKQGYLTGAFENEGTIGFKAKEGQATTDKAPVTTADISLLTYIVTNAKTKKTIDIVMLKNNNTNEAKVWAENETVIYTLVNRSMVEKPNTASTNTTKASFSTCYQQYGVGVMNNCPNCINCINACWSKNKKGKRISCALTGCVGSCAPCIRNFYGFVNCIFN